MKKVIVIMALAVALLTSGCAPGVGVLSPMTVSFNGIPINKR